eukprot:14877346-Alexandrium_andersonii.AAC.1
MRGSPQSKRPLPTPRVENQNASHRGPSRATAPASPWVGGSWENATWSGACLGAAAVAHGTAERHSR